MTWFTEIEEVTYSVVEYIPVLGTLYSIPRASIAHREGNRVNFWQSLANTVEGSVRDIILLGEIAEPIPAVIVHTMVESITSKVIEIYHREPVVKVDKRLRRGSEHVLVAESSQGEHSSKIFSGKAKGVHHFYGAVFIGTLTHPEYAPNGTMIRLDIPHGLYDGAQVTFSWRWTTDASGTPNSPTATLGTIRLKEGTPTEFELSKRKGDSGWYGYDFSGQIMSKDQIIATTNVGGRKIKIDFERVSKN